MSCTDGYGPRHIKLILEWKATVYRRYVYRVTIMDKNALLMRLDQVEHAL